MTAAELHRMAEIWRWLARQSVQSDVRAVFMEWAERCVMFADQLPFLRELAACEIRPLFGGAHHVTGK